MQRWEMVFVIGIVIMGLLIPTGFAVSGPVKEKTVTLEISGMT